MGGADLTELRAIFGAEKFAFWSNLGAENLHFGAT